MGRPDGHESALGVGPDHHRGHDQEQQRLDTDTDTVIYPSFPHIIPQALPHEYESYGIYTRADTAHILGDDDAEQEGEAVSSSSTSRCFNCGSDSHSVKECPLRLNRDLIDLSRQYYQFYKGTLGTTNYVRVHVAEGWRQSRLTWLEDFEPGEVRGALLREALGKDGASEWLRNIAVWGYPKGWVAERDPRELVRERIWREHGGNVEMELDDSEPFVIYGDSEDQQAEVILFSDAFQHRRLGDEDEAEAGANPDVSSESVGSDSESESETETEAESPEQSSKANTHSPFIKRWAKYPSSHFHPDLLPIHNGFSLGSVRGTSDLSQPSFHEALPKAKFDWDTWAASHVQPEPPPAPSEPPPPLPPPPDTEPPPLPPGPDSSSLPPRAVYHHPPLRPGSYPPPPPPQYPSPPPPQYPPPPPPSSAPPPPLPPSPPLELLVEDEADESDMEMSDSD